MDGTVYASPLIVGGRVVAATKNNTVYAFDLSSGVVVWKTHLGTPVDASSLPCGNIAPVSGITGTPAADAQSGQLYLVAYLAGFHHVLFTLNLADGSVTRRQGIDPPGANVPSEQQRSALSIANGRVYVPFGGLFGDCGPYHGYVLGVPLEGGNVDVYRTPSARESGIWSPMGATFSDTGQVWVVTGTSSFDYSNSVIQLSVDLKVQGFFAPSDWASLDAGDVDLGSVGAAWLPALGVLVAIGKGGTAYLLRASNLGGIGGQVASRHVCSGAWGGSAWTGGRVFLPCIDGLVAVDVSATGLSVAWRAPQAGMASPIIAAGAVWAIDVNTSTLFALDITSGAVLYSLGLGDAQHFSTPAATQGYVVVPAGSSVVAVKVAP